MVAIVVEDQIDFRELVARQVRNMGFIVIEADNGRHALKLLNEKQCQVDLIVTDIMMPEMGGIEMVNAIRANNPDTPAVFISGYIDEASDPPYANRRISRYIAKPFTMATLAANIRQVLPATEAG